jgi:hypothetical protein
VKSELATTKDVKSMDISVKTIDGVVHLSGRKEGRRHGKRDQGGAARRRVGFEKSEPIHTTIMSTTSAHLRGRSHRNTPPCALHERSRRYV